MFDELKEEQKASLEELTIGELRTLGRELSVKSPTTLSKAELVAEIISIVYGGIVSPLKETRGRPSKTDEGGVFEYQTISTQEASKVKLSSSIDGYEIVGKKVSDDYIYEGYVDEDKLFGSIVRYDNGKKFVLLSHDVLIMYNLKLYDNVLFSAISSSVSTASSVLDILKINGVKVSRMQERKEFSDLTIMPPNSVHGFVKKNELINCLTKVAPIPQGGRVLIVGEESESRQKMMIDLIKSFSDIYDNRVFSVVFDYKKELISILNSEGYSVDDLGAGKNASERLKLFVKPLYRAERYASSGENVVVIIDSLNSVYDMLDQVVVVDNKSFLMDMVVKMFNIGCRFKEGGSLTVCATMDTSNLAFVTKARRSATVYLPLSEELVKNNVYPAIDLKNVDSNFKSFYLDEQAVEIVENIQKLASETTEIGVVGSLVARLKKEKAIEKLEILEKIKNL